MRIFKKKGFTLIELLAVIVLLGVISIIAIPNIAKLLKDNKQNLYEKQLDVIETAARLWTIEEENKIFLMSNQSWPYFITISDLKASSFIDGDINNPLTEKPFPESTIIEIDYVNNNYVFSVEESSIDENSAIIKLNGDKYYDVDVYENYVDLGATAVDYEGNDISTNITTEIYQRGLLVSSVDTTILTNYTIKYTVTYTDIDSNYHTAVETRRVNIIDREAPTLSCENYCENNINIESSSSINLPEVVVSDNYDNDISIVKIGTISSIVPGNKKLIYVATDDSGNSTSLEFNYIVKDTIAPIITEILLLEDSSNSLKYYKVNATDSGSGIKEYSFDGGKTWQKSNIYYLNRNNTGSELVFVKDNAGNIASAQLQQTNFVYSNGSTIYFDVKKGIGCTVEEYESSYDSTIDDFQNSLTGYNGINGTGNQNSCLKFYAFNDKEGEEKIHLLLDHNTTAILQWNSSGVNSNGPSTEEPELLWQLKSDTASWNGTLTPDNYKLERTAYGTYEIDYSDYKARLISVREIAMITGNQNYDESTSNYDESWFYLATNSQTMSSDCLNGNQCQNAWLYDRASKDCTDYGCEHNSDVATGGYWTSTAVIGYGDDAYGVRATGSISRSDVHYDDDFGVRPVIKVLKSKLINDITGEDTNTTYEITYNCNGGTGSTASSTHTYGVASNLSTNGCSRITTGTGTGTSASPNVYSFVGWSTSSTATEATYTDGQSVTDIAESGTVTLYAVWSKLFTYSNKYQVIDDNNGNWRVKFLASGTFTPKASTSIDIFLVGGGGGGHAGLSNVYEGSGGGGGYTKTYTKQSVTASKTYSVTIGTGGSASTGDGTAGTGGTSYFGSSYSASGGKGGTNYAHNVSKDKGGDGGSGGATWYSEGGSYGNDAYDWADNGSTPGSGQGTTTCEFGQGTLRGCNSGVDAYGGGGGGGLPNGHVMPGGDGGGGANNKNGDANTGGGGGGGDSTNSTAGGKGGTGIVIIRNAR